MKLVLSEEHRLLRESAAEFVRSKSSLKRIRALRDSGHAAGFSRDLWHEMAELGWAGIVVAERARRQRAGVLALDGRRWRSSAGA